MTVIPAGPVPRKRESTTEVAQGVFSSVPQAGYEKWRGTGVGSRFTRSVHAVFEAVYEGLPGGFDDVLGDADGSPHPLAVRRVYEDAGRCGRGAVLVEDADLVVGEVDLVQLRIVRPDGFPQRLIEGVYRTITLRCRNDPLPAYRELYGRLCGRLPVGPLLGDDPERLQLEERSFLS